MRVYVNQDCVGCGMCHDVCPEVFYMTGAGTAAAVEADVPPAEMENTKTAMEGCPVDAIQKK